MALPADLINLATNPTAASTTNYAAVAGTGGTAALTNVATVGYSGNGFNRTTWSAATTAPSGGQSYTQTGLTAGATYAIAVYARSSKAQTIQLTADFRTASASVNTAVGNPVALAANTWTKLAVNGISGAAVDRVAITAAAASTGALWAISDTFDLDAVLIILAPAAARANAVINPSIEPTGTTGYGFNAGTGGAGTGGRSTATAGFNGAAFYRFTWTTGTTAPSGFAEYTLPGSSITAGTTYTFSSYVRPSRDQYVSPRIQWRAGTPVIQTDVGPAILCPANVWTRLTLTATAPATATGGRLDADVSPTATAWAIGDTFDWDALQMEASTYALPYFDGSTTNDASYVYGWAGAVGASISYQWPQAPYFDGTFAPDSSYRYLWSGTANASTSRAEYRGVWVEVVAGTGAPTAQVTVSGLGLVAGNVQVTRTADGETWTVPGWLNRSVVDTDTDTDFSVPLGRTVTYTVFFNGAQVGQKSVTIPSATGWIQSPYDPTSAMPINTTLTDTAVLTLAKGSLDARAHVTNSTRVAVMGASRPYSIGSQRMADAGATFILHAWKNSTSDQLKAMIAQAPVLLVRGLPAWGSIPGIAYLDAPAQEIDATRYKNYPRDGLTKWVLAGDLVQPVSRKPLTGAVTNDQVQTNLAGTTYNTILARSGAKKNVDVKANPLGL